MATRDDVIQAIRNADAAGDTASVQRLGQYLTTMPAGNVAPAPTAADAVAADRAKYTPSNGFADDLLSGVGRGMTSVGRAVGQAIGSGIDTVAPSKPTLSSLVTPQPTLSSRLGLPQQSDVDAARVTDGPLMSTTGGKIGNVAGQVAAVAPAMFVPGANTALGSAAVGAGLGALTTEGGLADRTQGAMGGAIGGLGGNLLGKGVSAAASKLADMRAASIAAKAVADGGKPAAIQAAQQAGYVLPPTEINPSITNSILEGFSGKIKTSQSASQTNQATTNKLAQQALGLPPTQAITPDVLKAIRAKAGADYQALGSTGTVSPGASYDNALDAIVAPYQQAARSFPGGPVSPAIDQINALRTPQFDAADALAKISTLREAADTAYGQQNKTLGKSLKSAAGALEDALDAHVNTLKNGAEAFEGAGDVAPGTLPDYGNMLDNFRSARQRIAQTYNVQKALNPQTGDVSAANLATQLGRGAPLSNELATIAGTAQAFPKAMQTLKQNYNALSPLDFVGPAIGAFGEMGAGGSPTLAALSAAGVAARPLARSAILSPTYQRFTTPSAPSATNRLLDMLASDPQKQLSQLGGMQAARDYLGTAPAMVIRGSPANQ